MMNFNDKDQENFKKNLIEEFNKRLQSVAIDTLEDSKLLKPIKTVKVKEKVYEEMKKEFSILHPAFEEIFGETIKKTMEEIKKEIEKEEKKG